MSLADIAFTANNSTTIIITVIVLRNFTTPRVVEIIIGEPK